MKLFKFLFSLLFLLSLSINFSSAGGVKDVCKGQPVNLIWTSTGAASCAGGLQSGDPSCSYGPNLGGILSIPNPQSSCSVNYSCNGSGGNGYDSAYLVVDQTTTWNGSACVANSPRGTHDGFIGAPNAPVTYGWAIDDDEPNTALTIHFYIDGTYISGTIIGSTVANVFRGDGGIGNHGFNFSIPTQYCDGNTHNVYAYGINVGASGFSTLLSSSPRSFSCNPPAGAPTLNVTRNPVLGAVGTAYTVSWNSTNATTVSYACVGPFTQSATLPTVNGSVSNTYKPDWVGTTNCTWTATGPGGTVTKPDNFTVTAIAPASCPVGYTGTPPNCVLIPVTPLWVNYCGNGANSKNVINRIWQYRSYQPSDIRMHPDNLPCCTADGYYSTSACVAPPSCSSGLNYSIYGPSCACPAGQAQVGSICQSVGTANIVVTWSGLVNPSISLSCPTPLNPQSLTRNGVAINSVSGTDTGVTSNNSAFTYTYVLTCVGIGVNSGITRTATQSITIPPKVKITNLEDVISPMGDSVNLRWNSTGNECSVYDSASVLISPPAIATRTGTNPNYLYTYALTPNSPQFRTELNSRRIGSDKLSYIIKCKDTAEPIRGVAEDKSIVEVFKKPLATITGPNASNQLTFSCSPDYNKVDIKVNGTSTIGYPKTYVVAPSSNFSNTLSYDASKSYLLTCSYNTFSDQASKSNDLQIFGEINGVSGIADSTATASSSDGIVNNLTYTISNFDSWAIEVRANADGTGAPDLSGTNSSVGTLGTRYAPNSGGEVTIVNNSTVYNNGLNVKIVAKKGSVTKTLTLKLIKVTDIFADVKIVSAATDANPDLVNIDITCKNATSYELYKNGTKMPGYPLPISEEIFNNRVPDTASAVGDEATYKVKCMAGSQFKESSAKINIPSKTKVSINTLLIQPNQIACPGGNDSATLKFILGNTAGKTCKINATAINENPNKADKIIQMTALNGILQLTSNNYKSSNSTGFKSLEDLVKDKNGSNVSGGQIVLSSVNKLSNDKRLFNYSTRFTMECGSLAEPIATRYVKTNASYSSKSVDMLSTCIGQD